MGKNVSELNEKNFDDFISDGITVVDFWAPWCGPCKMMSPIFEEAAEEMKGKVNFAKVNVDEESDIAQRFQVMSIPTLIIFKDGDQIDNSVGVLEKEELIDKIKEVSN